MSLQPFFSFKIRNAGLELRRGPARPEGGPPALVVVVAEPGGRRIAEGHAVGAAAGLGLGLGPGLGLGLGVQVASRFQGWVAAGRHLLRPVGLRRSMARLSSSACERLAVSWSVADAPTGDRPFAGLCFCNRARQGARGVLVARWQTPMRAEDEQLSFQCVALWNGIMRVRTCRRSSLRRPLSSISVLRARPGIKNSAALDFSRGKVRQHLSPILVPSSSESRAIRRSSLSRSCSAYACGRPGGSRCVFTCAGACVRVRACVCVCFVCVHGKGAPREPPVRRPASRTGC
jgi:hypothetical protein